MAMLPPTIHHRAWAERIDCVYYSIREVGLTLIEGQAIRSYSTTVFYSISHRQRLDGYSPPPRLVVHSCERQTSRHTPYCRTKFNPKKKKKFLFLPPLCEVRLISPPFPTGWGIWGGQIICKQLLPTIGMHKPTFSNPWSTWDCMYHL